MAWLQVVLDELTDMSHKFQLGSDEYGKVSDEFKVPAPDSGDGRLSALIASTLDVVDILNRQVCGEINVHGALVSKAKDAYQRRDIDNRELFDDMMKEKL